MILSLIIINQLLLQILDSQPISLPHAGLELRITTLYHEHAPSILKLRQDLADTAENIKKQPAAVYLQFENEMPLIVHLLKQPCSLNMY